ncbi:hypothetical protein K7432_018132 [Basidiobolus ranarum]|uniref:FAD/NAD(P)-binding domain-containing protein n=1 Tax=Basidiobolus ranarum TaxID=34480 RepID=A0ABR2WCJ4_9FUNG
MLSLLSVSGITQDTVQLEKSIIIDGVETNTISFAFLVLATGSKSTFPVRPTVFTIEGVKKAFTDFQQDLSKAKKVLVVGGGPVGFEFAGEVTEFYNGTNGRDKKQVTLVSSGKHLLDPTFKQGTHNKALALLKNSGVNTILGQTITLPEGINNGSLGETKTFNLSSGETVEADFILLGIGSRPNNDIVVAGLGQSAVDLKSGRVLVNSTLQLKEYPNIFAIGDINSIAENKMAAWTGAHAAIVGKNIKALISNTPLKDYKAVSPGMLASYGAKAGAGQFFGISPPSFLAAIIKSKSLFASMLWSSANATLSS